NRSKGHAESQLDSGAVIGDLFHTQPTTSHAQEAIGKATSVRPQAEGSHAGTLSGGSNVYSKETVRTADTAQPYFQFHDSSNLSVGPKSSVRLDKVRVRRE